MKTCNMNMYCYYCLYSDVREGFMLVYSWVTAAIRYTALCFQSAEIANQVKVKAWNTGACCTASPGRKLAAVDFQSMGERRAFQRLLSRLRDSFSRSRSFSRHAADRRVCHPPRAKVKYKIKLWCDITWLERAGGVHAVSLIMCST